MRKLVNFLGSGGAWEESGDQFGVPRGPLGQDFRRISNSRPDIDTASRRSICSEKTGKDLPTSACFGDSCSVWLSSLAGSPMPQKPRSSVCRCAYLACAAVRAQHIESAALPEQRQACRIIIRFDMHFMHVSILDMQIACPDMTLVMS